MAAEGELGGAWVVEFPCGQSCLSRRLCSRLEDDGRPFVSVERATPVAEVADTNCATGVVRSFRLDSRKEKCSFEHVKDLAGRGWYDRGYLPHLEVNGRAIGITFRLVDSLPREVVEQMKRDLNGVPESEIGLEMARKVAAYEDAGRGNCWLRIPEYAAIVADALRHSAGERYDLLEWCVMPNHVHVLIQLCPGSGFEKVVRSWKNFTARRINERLGKSGRFWAPDFFDRLIRDEQHLARARRYIRMNPVKAGLCQSPEDWQWGSVWAGQERTTPVAHDSDLNK